jgi:hypothetical protein
LEWDEVEQAYYLSFLSCDGKTKNNIWLSEPASDLAKISYKGKKKKQRDNMKKRKEEEECADNQQSAQDKSFCCHHHAKRLKNKEEEEGSARNKRKWTVRITASTAMKTRAFSYKSNRVCVRTTQSTTTDVTMRTLPQHTTAGDVNVPTSMQHLCFGKGSTTAGRTTPV